MKTFNLQTISKFRAELMGVATIMIICCHGPANGVSVPSIVDKVVRSWGGLGVDMFLFLSGIGLYYSLRKKNILKSWYKHRYTRILVPYLLISIPYYVFRWIVEDDTFLHLLGNITTISYWTRHQGAWFVALLLPLYLCTPLIAKFIDGKRKRIYPTLCLCGLSVIVYYFSKSLDVSDSISQASWHLPAFFLGYWAGKYVFEEKQIRIDVVLLVSILIFIAYAVFMYVRLPKDYLLMVPGAILFSALLNIKSESMVNKALSFMGGVSLESYLMNIYLPVVLRKIGYSDLFGNYDPNRYIFYLIVIVGGILLAYWVHLCSQRIINKCKI